MKKSRTICVSILLFVVSALIAFAFIGCSDEGLTPSQPNNNPSDNLMFIQQSDGTYGVKTTNKNIEGSLVIPASYNNADVSIVLEKGFFNCTKLTSVVIPNSVKVIDKEAFFNCYGLKSVTIYPSIKEIKFEAFRGCNEFDYILIGNKPDFNYNVASGAYEDSTPNYIYQPETT